MKKFEFQDNGRTFTCEAATSRATPDQMWWWVNVSGDSLRYAAFHMKKGDTITSVRPRIVEYYAKVLADRERPPLPRPTFGPGRPPAQKQVQPD
ncbi:MAG TPA: hypothetical protein VFT29_02900 [Gemmatimonadaceae bacterium]|nr:hypothetical protein [Gemmatimonadaceae bacterium]